MDWAKRAGVILHTSHSSLCLSPTVNKISIDILNIRHRVSFNVPRQSFAFFFSAARKPPPRHVIALLLGAD